MNSATYGTVDAVPFPVVPSPRRPGSIRLWHCAVCSLVWRGLLVADRLRREGVPDRQSAQSLRHRGSDPLVKNSDGSFDLYLQADS
ncbi:MAG: hypothetical protein ACRDJC_01535 [Thermomicrobiales bacterium]